MAFLENLAEGFARAAGAEGTASAIERKKQRREALSDLELQNQTQQILGDVGALQDRRAKLDPNSPTYQKDLQTIDQALHDARGVFTDLYHPEKNPGALEKLGGYISRHLGKGQAQPAPALTPAQARANLGQQVGAIEQVAYGQSQPENPYAKISRQIREANPGMSEEEIQRRVDIAAGFEAKPTNRPAWKEYVSPDGKSRQWIDVSDANNIPAGWQPVPTRGEQSSAPKVGSFGDFMIQAYGAHPTAEQYQEGRQRWQQSGAGTTVGEHIITVPQPDGSIKSYRETTVSTKTYGTPPPTVPTTPGAARTRVAPTPHASIAPTGTTVGGRLTAPQSAAQKKYDEAEGLVKIAELVAGHPDDAVNQKRLAVQLERLSAGRFTTQALDYIIRAGWGNTIQQWANNITTGALPPDIVRQLVDGANEYREGARAELQASGAPVPGNAPAATGADQDVDDIIKALQKPAPQKPQ